MDHSGRLVICINSCVNPVNIIKKEFSLVQDQYKVAIFNN